MLNQYMVGLDIGQLADYTALAVLQVHPKDRRRYRLVYLERVRELLYPQVADWVEMKLDNLSEHGTHQLIVDCTGVGPAVTDLLTARGSHFKGVKIHGGDHEKYSERHYRIPKRNLVNNLQVLLFEGRLQMAEKLRHVKTLRDELIKFKMKENPITMHDSYSAWREGDHDDLVLATALAAWGANRFGGAVNASLARNDGPFSGAGFKPTDLPFSA